MNIKEREVDVFVIHENNEWVDELLIHGAVTANELFDFNITGILERPQLLRYKAPSTQGMIGILILGQEIMALER